MPEMDSLLKRKLDELSINIEINDLPLKNKDFIKGLLYGYYWAFIELFFSRKPNQDEIDAFKEYIKKKEKELMI